LLIYLRMHCTGIQCIVVVSKFHYFHLAPQTVTRSPAVARKADRTAYDVQCIDTCATLNNRTAQITSLLILLLLLLFFFFFFFFFFLLERPLFKNLYAPLSSSFHHPSFQMDIGMKFGTNVRNVNRPLHRLTESDFWFDVIISKWRLWRHFTQESAVLPPN